MEIDIDKKLKETEQWLQQEYAGIRTGQASPLLLDKIKVESYGARVPLQQIGTIGVEDARTLRVSIWDASTVGAAEEAIREADLGVSVSSDSTGLRVIFPELTAERREQLLKLAKSKLEEARIGVRSSRDEAMKSFEKAEKDGDISEDEKYAQKESVQEKVDAANKRLESLYTQKETELKK